nr:helix-turn-helix domain-containing protein [Rhodococcus wratislaviensis]GLK40764.1 hypothetical protein GCM10017611_76390 [Rhodococcus wratislaviensis]
MIRATTRVIRRPYLRRGPNSSRPHKLDDTQAVRELRGKGMTVAEVGKVLGASRASLYRYLADDEEVSA